MYYIIQLEECPILNNDHANDDRFFVFGALPIVANMLDKLLERQLAAYDMTAKQWLLTAVIEKQFEKPPTIKEAAKAMGSSHQNIKQVALKLERKGFLELKKDEKDSRVTRLVVTDRSREFWSELDKTCMEFIEKVFEDVNKKDLAVSRKCIEKIVLNMSSMESDEPGDENETE